MKKILEKMVIQTISIRKEIDKLEAIDDDALRSIIDNISVANDIIAGNITSLRWIMADIINLCEKGVPT